MPSFKVTSPELNVRPLPDKNNTPIGRLKEGAIVEKLGESGDWAFIKFDINTDSYRGDIAGWVSSKFFAPAEQLVTSEQPVCPDEPFSIDSNLKERPSPLTAELIEKYFQEKGKPGLAGIGEAVMAAAKKYGINATYIVAHAIHETGWGTSPIYKNKNNLFGYMAYTEDPSQAGYYDSREECIDYVMRKVNTNYLSEDGKYFEGSPCPGDLEKGYGMNVHYATDPHWAQAIADYAEHMEEWVKKQVPAPQPQPTPGQDPQRILDAVNRLDPEMDYYEPHDVTGDGRPETFCNVYVSDVLYLLGIKLPRTQEKCPAGNPIMPDDRYMPLMANQLNAYFNDGGGGHWTEVNRQKAVSLANKGNVVVVSMVEAGHGHIALVIPGGKGDKVHIAQAGHVCSKDMLLEEGFGRNADVQFFQFQA